MVTTPLAAILEELGNTALVSITALKVNAQDTCVIPFPDGLQVQIEMDRYEKNIILCCVLGDLEPGEYRRKIFREALRANGLPPPLYGTLAFSAKSDKLVLFETMDLRTLTGFQIADYLPGFLEKARVWRDALAGKNVPAITSAQSQGGRFFGMKI